MSLSTLFMQKYVSSIKDSVRDFENVVMLRIFLPATSELDTLLLSHIPSCNYTVLADVNGAIVDMSNTFMWTRLVFPDKDTYDQNWILATQVMIDNRVAAAMTLVKERLLEMIDNPDAVYMLGNIDNEMKVVFDNIYSAIKDAGINDIAARLATTSGPVFESMKAAYNDVIRFPLAESWFRGVNNCMLETKFDEKYPIICNICRILYTLYRFDVLNIFTQLDSERMNKFLAVEISKITTLNDDNIVTIAHIGRLDNRNTNIAIHNNRKQDIINNLTRVNNALSVQKTTFSEKSTSDERQVIFELRVLIAVTVFSLFYIVYAYGHREVLYRYPIVLAIMALAFLGLVSVECVQMMKQK